MQKLAKKIKTSEKSISETVCNLFINQSKIDDVVEKHRTFNFDILLSQRQLKDVAKSLKISEEDFDAEFEKNGCNKNWLKTFPKRQIKNGARLRKRTCSRNSQ